MSRILAVRMVDGWAVVLAALLALPCVARSVHAQREASSRAELGYSPVANLSYQPQANLGYVSPEQRAILGAAKTHQGSQSVLTNDPAVRERLRASGREDLTRSVALSGNVKPANAFAGIASPALQPSARQVGRLQTFHAQPMAPLTARTQNLKSVETFHAGLHQRPEVAFSHDHVPHGSPHVNSNGRNSYRERDFSGPFGKRSSLEGH